MEPKHLLAFSDTPHNSQCIPTLILFQGSYYTYRNKVLFFDKMSSFNHTKLKFVNVWLDIKKHIFPVLCQCPILIHIFQNLNEEFLLNWKRLLNHILRPSPLKTWFCGGTAWGCIPQVPFSNFILHHWPSPPIPCTKKSCCLLSPMNR